MLPLSPEEVMETQSQPKLILNLREAADLLGIRPSQLYEHTRARARARQRIPIPYLRLGKRICFRRESLERWIAQLEGSQR
jgi:predicted DNA-binding transcriptional regulator AlpA